MDLLSIYYDLSEIMHDDMDILVDAIKEHTHSKKKKIEIKRRLERLNLDTLEDELNTLYDVEITVLKRFAFAKTKNGIQTDIYDFL